MKHVVQYGGVCWHFPRAYIYSHAVVVCVNTYLAVFTAGTAFTIHVHMYCSTHTYIPTDRENTH